MGYATPTDFATFGLPSPATSGMASATVQSHLDAASSRIDEALSARGALPVAGSVGPPNTYPPRLVQLVCDIAGYTILKTRGFNPEAPNDVAILDAHDRAIEQLDAIAGFAAIPWAAAQPLAAVASDAPREWYVADNVTATDDGTGAIR